MANDSVTICAPWTSIERVVALDPDLDADSETLSDAIIMASEILFDLTRQRWPGLCTDIVRPCWRSDCYMTARDLEVLVKGGTNDHLSQAAFDTGRRQCGCAFITQWELPGNPVVEIVQVKIDGDVIPSNEYAIDNDRKLVGLRGHDNVLRRWPTCQRLDVPDTEEQTWSVTYKYGFAPPAGGRISATALAQQLTYAFNPKLASKCRLPRRTTSINRQGETITMIDASSLAKDGMTGLPDVDMWVGSVNRGSATRGGAVIDPMIGRDARRRV